MKRISLFMIITSLICFPVLVSAREPGHTPSEYGLNVAAGQESIILAAALDQGLQTVERSYVGYPTFMIEEVTEDQEVSILGSNFPPDDSFVVRMHYYGTAGIGGTVVGTVDTDDGGAISGTFTIPAAYHGLWKIAIRMDSTTSGYYAYNWFFNNSTNGEGGEGTTTGYTGYPYFYIDAVTRDEAVTINGYNFPPDDKFNVRMKYYGSRGIGGIIVETIETDEGGKLSATFKIPSQLAGEYRIAIRMESPVSGYYAYNWFFNNTTYPPAELP
jgi:hypothetical protein